jgi:hypothetical protein
VAALALMSLLAALVVGGFQHTDDGCAIEIHCQVCVFALLAADGVTPPVVVLPSLGQVEAAAPPHRERPRSGQTWFIASRGPPSA